MTELKELENKLETKIHNTNRRTYDNEKEIALMKQDILYFKAGVEKVASNQNQAIDKLIKDTEKFRDFFAKEEGKKTVLNWMAANWFNIFLTVLVIFALINEEKILHLIK